MLFDWRTGLCNGGTLDKSIIGGSPTSAGDISENKAEIAAQAKFSQGLSLETRFFLTQRHGETGETQNFEQTPWHFDAKHVDLLVRLHDPLVRRQGLLVRLHQNKGSPSAVRRITLGGLEGEGRSL